MPMPRYLTLIRHAKSSWSDDSLDDFDRPLNKRGKRDAPFMAERLATRGVMPDALVSSPARRAAATANKLAKGIAFGKDSIAWMEEIYHASVPELLAVIHSFDPAWRHVWLIGHNPGLTDLVNSLDAKAGIDNISTCGVVEIELDVNAWSDVTPGDGRVSSFDYPKKVKVDA